MTDKLDHRVRVTHLHIGLKRNSRVLVGITLLVGVLVLISWFFDIALIKRPIPELTAMNPTTALCFILTALSFFLIAGKDQSPTRLRISDALTAMVLIIALLRIIGNITNIGFDVDRILFVTKIEADALDNLSSRMAPNTALNFLLSAIVLLFMRQKGRAIFFHQSISIIIALISLFSILGYIYQVKEFYGILAHLPMALHSAACFFLFALAALFHSCEEGLMKELTGPFAGSTIGRVFIPFAILVPFLLGYLRLIADWNLGFTAEFGVAILILSIIIVFVFFIWYFAFSLNVQDRLRWNTQNELQLAYTLLHSSLESHKDVLIFSINDKYEYLNFNTAFKTATAAAYGKDVVEGQSMLDCITDEKDRRRAKENCDKALAGERHTTVESFGEHVKNYFETRYNPVVDDDDKVIGVTVLSANITDRKNWEDQIQTLNKELEAFTYSVSHDLRAPLRSIRGFSQVLQDEYGQRLDEEGNRLLNIVMKNAGQMGHLIDDLLDFSRLGRKELTYTTVGTRQLVSQTIRELSALEVSREIQFEVQALPDMRADPSMMRQVWINLISNALKYTRTRPKAEITIGSYQNGGHLVYFIRDNGVGFDMQYSNKLFNVFQRLHAFKEFEGTGVGLALTHRIITKHKGKIWAEAQLDKGATFFFFIN